MTIRAKFSVASLKSFSFGSGQEVTLIPQYDTSIPEDQRFSDATPSGELKMFINNPAALAELTLGKAFYIDLTPVHATSKVNA